jgi:hypothetical protein
LSGRRPRRKSQRKMWYVAAALVAVAVVLGAAVLTYHAGHTTTSAASSQSESGKYVILYINQGNGAVNQTNFGSMLSFASSQGFNTIFFQMYRQGVTLFDTSQLTTFVAQAHAENMKLFFSLYITDPSQTIPTSIYPLGEDGISLDMSALPVANQSDLLSTLQGGYSGTTAITTTDLTLPLKPDLLVLETYTADIQDYSQYLNPGVIGSVGVFATTSRSNYQQEFQYVLDNSGGVMVFDYAGLLKSSY